MTCWIFSSGEFSWHPVEANKEVHVALNANAIMINAETSGNLLPKTNPLFER
jgi:hypothetical protein